MMPTDQPSGSSQMVRIGLPSTFIIDLSSVDNLSYVARLAHATPLPQCRPGWRHCMAAIDYEFEYDMRARVPEHPELFARLARDAEDYRAETLKAGRAELGVSYGDTPRQIIDLFLPE